MRWLVRTRVGRILFALVLLGAAAICTEKYCFEPHIQLAKLSEVESTVPPQLLEKWPRDTAAQARLLRLIGFIDSFSQKQLASLANKTSTALDRMYLADHLWGDERIRNVQSLLAEGPISLPDRELGERKDEIISHRPVYEMYSQLKVMARALAESASVYRQFGDQKAAARCLLIALLFQDRVQGLHGPLLQYLVASAIDGLLMHTIAAFGADPRCSAKECKLLLDAIEPAAAVDTDLVASWRAEFQQEILPRLPNPFLDLKSPSSTKNDEDATQKQDPARTEFETTYDAITTSRLAGNLIATAMENAKTPLSQFSDKGERLQVDQAKGLPKPPTLDEMSSSRRRTSFFLFRLSTYRTPNYYGRVMISDMMGSRNITEVSARSRSLHDATRVLLATRIYRSTHGGALPRSKEALRSILGDWPTDPYDGKPMRYNSRNHVVYAVGSNLIDDGGNIGGSPNRVLDRGISLALHR